MLKKRADWVYRNYDNHLLSRANQSESQLDALYKIEYRNFKEKQASDGCY